VVEFHRILAVDDRPEILRLIERSLGGGYEVALAADVPSARAELAERPFGLVLCDIEMPGESGLVLARELGLEHPHTAVVLVTGEDDPEVAERAFELGVDGYLVKPFWPGQLKITVLNALRRRQLEQAERERSRLVEERLQVLMDRAPIPVYMKDAERRFVLANRVVHEIWGVEPYQMIGHSTAEFASPEVERSIAAVDDEVLRGGVSSESEETLTIQDLERTFLTARFPLLDDAGDVAGICGISRDVTDMRRADSLRDQLAASQELAIEGLRASRQETVDRLSRAIELHDAGTGVHIQRMAKVATLLAERYGLSTERTLLLRAAAPMHDVGKVATPDAILRKQGPLTVPERAEMERHAEVGHRILADSTSDLLQMAAMIALTHHERWDGSGYPRGLRGKEIPVEGRIVAVADVFDALLSDRSYRAALPLDETLAIIEEGRGRHFDPALVDLLVDNVEEALSLRS
jgi:PAS domain S-box-containing protein